MFLCFFKTMLFAKILGRFLLIKYFIDRGFLKCRVSAVSDELMLNKKVSNISPESTPASYLNKLVQKKLRFSIMDQFIGERPRPSGRFIELPCIPNTPIEMFCKIFSGISLCHPTTKAASRFILLIV